MRLLGNRCSHDGMTMAMQGHPPAADGIDQGRRPIAEQQSTLSGHNALGRCSGGQLGEGRPEIGVT